MKLFQLHESVTLNHHQRYILLQVKLAATPTLAFDQTSRSEADVRSREMLAVLGLIRRSEATNEVQLTSDGEQALINYGLIDEHGEVTEVAQELLDSHQS